MKSYIALFSAAISLAACSTIDKPAIEAHKSAAISACNVQHPMVQGQYANHMRCVGSAMLDETNALHRDPSFLLAALNSSIAIYERADAGTISKSDADLQAKFALQEELAKSQQRSELARANRPRPVHCTTHDWGYGNITTQCY